MNIYDGKEPAEAATHFNDWIDQVVNLDEHVIRAKAESKRYLLRACAGILADTDPDLLAKLKQGGVRF